MKLKYYLRGIAVGIFISTLVLMIAFAFHKPKMSDEEIMARAKQLGMVMDETKEDTNRKNTDKKNTSKADTDNKNTDKTDTDNKNTVKSDIDKKNTMIEKSKTDKTANNKSKTDKTANNKSKTDNKATNSKSNTEQVSFTIYGGEGSRTIADRLAKEGIVDDGEKFNAYLSEYGYDNILQPGTFLVPKGADYPSLAKILVLKQEFRQPMAE